MQLQIEIKRMITFENEGTVKALCDVAIDEKLLVRGLRIVDGKNGLFVSMPRIQARDGKWFDLVRPTTRELRSEIEAIVLEAYHSKPATA